MNGMSPRDGEHRTERTFYRRGRIEGRWATLQVLKAARATAHDEARRAADDARAGRSPRAFSRAERVRLALLLFDDWILLLERELAEGEVVVIRAGENEDDMMEWLEKGRTSSLAEVRDILDCLLGIQGLHVAEEHRRQIRTCTALGTFQRWFERAVTATTGNAVFELPPVA